MSKRKNKHLIKKWNSFLTEYSSYKEKLKMAKILEKQQIDFINNIRSPLTRRAYCDLRNFIKIESV